MPRPTDRYRPHPDPMVNRGRERRLGLPAGSFDIVNAMECTCFNGDDGCPCYVHRIGLPAAR